MLKSKAVITRWANEIVRCEKILDENCSEQDRDKAGERIEAIMELYEKDFEAVMFLILKIEDIFQKDLTK